MRERPYIGTWFYSTENKFFLYKIVGYDEVADLYTYDVFEKDTRTLVGTGKIITMKDFKRIAIPLISKKKRMTTVYHENE